MKISFIHLSVVASLVMLNCSSKPTSVDVQLGISIDSFRTLISSSGYKLHDSSVGIDTTTLTHLFRIPHLLLPGSKASGTALYLFKKGKLSSIWWTCGYVIQESDNEHPNLSDFHGLVSWVRSKYGYPRDSTTISISKDREWTVLKWGNEKVKNDKLLYISLQDSSHICKLSLLNNYSKGDSL